MAKECYLEIDGKRTKLTDEQLKVLGLSEEPKKSPFEKVEIRKTYYNISTAGDVVSSYEANDNYDNSRYDVANYCTDKELMQQRALRETLSRLLWRFTMENKYDSIDWKEETRVYYIVMDTQTNNLFVNNTTCRYIPTEVCYFYNSEIAQKAINEIIIPFMEKHPNFIW